MSVKGLWIPIEIVNDRSLTPMEKLVLAEIVQLANANGCHALNTHFADRFGVGKSRVSQIISGLRAKGRIKCELEREGKRFVSRTITPLENLTGVCRKSKEGIEETATTPLENLQGNKQGNKQYSPNSDEFQLARLLLVEIRRRKPDYKEPNLNNWARHVDWMIRRDKRKRERVEEVIRWCQSDDFWQNNILSTEKLRVQFDKLELAMDKEQNDGTGKIYREDTQYRDAETYTDAIAI